MSKHISEHPSKKTMNKMIGPYQLCEEIGRGGMGVVYRAERCEGGFKQQVAIKCLYPLNGGKKDKYYVEELFHRERQVLLDLKHAHIVQLLDGGICEDGHPYLVMEYVEGLPINQFCDEHSLSVHERIRLVLQVVGALEFAHQHCVVHRDIKPSNILVTKDHQVKLLDFGIAKYFSDVSLDQITATKDRLFTPEYSAPEFWHQAPITTSTDIYQLGLVLYELLTGRPVYQCDQSDSIVALAKTICETSPKKPSEFMTAEFDDHVSQNISRSRGLSPHQLCQLLKGDIDSILLKMLEQEPQHRYASMGALRNDITAYFENRPLSVQKNVGLYSLKKFSKRHWKQMLAPVLVSIIGVAFVTHTVLYLEEKQLVLKDRQQAMMHTQQVTDFLTHLFQDIGVDKRGIENVSAKQLLESAKNRIHQDLSTVPEVKSEMLLTLGEIYTRKRQYPKSIPLLKEALKIQSEVEPATELKAKILGELAYVSQKQGELYQVDAWIGESLKIYARLKREQAKVDQISYANTLTYRGFIYYAKGEYFKARGYYQQAISVFREEMLSGRKTLAENRLTKVLGKLANVQLALEHYEDAMQLRAESMKIIEAQGRKESPEYVIALQYYATALIALERFSEAEIRLDEAFILIEKLYGLEGYQYITNLELKGLLAYNRGQLEKAEGFYRSSLETRQSMESGSTVCLANTLAKLGNLYIDTQRFSKAEDALRQSYSIMMDLNNNPREQVMALHRLNQVYYVQGDLQKTQEKYLETKSLIADPFELPPAVKQGYAQVLMAFQHQEKAEELLRSALDESQKYLPAGHTQIAEIKAVLGGVLVKRRAFVEAESMLVAALEVLSSQPLYQLARHKRLVEDAKLNLSLIRDNKVAAVTVY